MCSDLEPYRGAPATRVRTREQWIEALMALARDRDAARRDGERLREWVMRDATLSAMLPQWSRALNAAS